MIAEIDAAHDDGDTLGGVIEVIAYGLPVGLGSYVQSDRRLDARLAGALMGIQAMKGVEIGDGFRTAHRRGSAAHDEMIPGDPVKRLSNRAGGIEGGMTNGEPVRVRVAMKPISTVPRALRTVDIATGEAATAIHQRSDVCAVPAGRASSPRRWSRWCWPTRRWRSSAATRSRRPAATSAPTGRPVAADRRQRRGRRHAAPP